MQVFKIFRTEEYNAFRAAGSSDGAPIDLVDGYIHLSTPEQVAGTLEKHFSGELGLYCLAVETDALGNALKWEPARGGALFPHLYRPLEAADVLWSAPIPHYNGRHIMPEGPE